ncbi:MAG: TlpA family protein disulfide reductase, partial [Chitinophagaceae bacterium]
IFSQFVSAHKDVSTDFIRLWTAELDYSKASTFFGYRTNNIFGIRDAYARNRSIWEKYQQDAFDGLPVSNDGAVAAPAYMKLVRNLVLRTKEAAWAKARTDRAAFLQTWYAEDTTTGWARFQADMENDLCARIIEKTFTGAAREYAYASLLESEIHSSSIVNLVSIYAVFKGQFPDSRYRQFFDGPMASIARKQQLPLTDRMKFIGNDSSYSTWEQVLATVKGKTVLLDMWGTWCGPCREEMNKNGDAIKKHFKGKNLDYLYIANYDDTNQEKWKQLIAYFNLEGYHLLASLKLSKDIMGKIKGNGYPTYAIIDKDGKVELSAAGYPMDREALIRQIESVLARSSSASAAEYHRPDVE